MIRSSSFLLADSARASFSAVSSAHARMSKPSGGAAPGVCAARRNRLQSRRRRRAARRRTLRRRTLRRRGGRPCPGPDARRVPAARQAGRRSELVGIRAAHGRLPAALPSLASSVSRRRWDVRRAREADARCGARARCGSDRRPQRAAAERGLAEKLALGLSAERRSSWSYTRTRSSPPAQPGPTQTRSGTRRRGLGAAGTPASRSKLGPKRLDGPRTLPAAGAPRRGPRVRILKGVRPRANFEFRHEHGDGVRVAFAHDVAVQGSPCGCDDGARRAVVADRAGLDRAGLDRAGLDLG